MIGVRNACVPRPRFRRPSVNSAVESLESRTLLAGNVITTPTGTPDSPGEPAPQLLIEGDALDNEIMVRKGNAPDEIIVNGLNGTLVNGSTQEWHFQGVESLVALMNGGNDKFDGRNLSLSGEADSASGSATAQVLVDGGQGDDRITLFNTTIDAGARPSNPEEMFLPSAFVGVFLFGETSAFGPTDGTGNDFIEVANTTIIADGGDSNGSMLVIYGEQNQGGTITGGNDDINVSNTVIRASNTSFAEAAIQIVGDDNFAGFGEAASVIGEGNDWIDVNGTTIVADDARGFRATGLVQISGDQNTADGTAQATIGNIGAKTGGDDKISLTNTTVSANGANLSVNSAIVDLRGDQNFSRIATATATIGGGNDTITVDNFDVSADGTMSDNTADLSIFGDGDYSATGLENFGRIGRGNDVIYVQNCDVTGTGTLNNSATLTLYSDDRTQTGETGSFPGEGTTVGEGTDDVQLSNFLLHADALGGVSTANVQLHTQKGDDVIDVFTIDVTGLAISTGSGNDELDILNSRWTNGNFDLEDGNDVLKMNSNTFVLTDADGGLGTDVLSARNNDGVLVAINFEQVNGMLVLGPVVLS